MLVWSLCVNSEGDILRPAGDVLWGWTMEEVLDAWEIKLIRETQIKRSQKAGKR